MTMAFKYQVSLSMRPNDVLLVTLNHMDAIRDFIKDSGPISQQVDFVYRLLLQHYASLTPGEFMLIRQTLLNFFQDMHIRVSIFLKDKVQNSNGRFVLPTSGPTPFGTEVPGTIRLFNTAGKEVKKATFNPTAKYTMSTKEGSFDKRGDRVTKLGTNMYNVARPAETTVSAPARSVQASSDMDMNNPNPLAKAQLDLLSKLIGSAATEKKKGKSDFRLNLFNTDEEEEEAASMRPVAEAGSHVISIDASKKKQSAELSRIMGELRVDDSNQDEDDLLDLMDKA